MTAKGFEELVRYLEGIFGVQMGRAQRDAYFLTLGPDADADVLAAAVAFVRSDRARYGFPKPGDLVPQPEPSRPAYLVEAERYEHERASRALPEDSVSREEAALVVGALRGRATEPPKLRPVSVAGRIRAWRKKEQAP